MALAASIFDHEGRLVELGEKLGAGGEGSVFAVPRRGSDLVAKLYHTPLVPEKHAKLASMVACGTEALRGISAWPQALLHSGHRGPVRGFLMPRLFEHEAVHNVYGPAHRKAKYPKADWAFLVRVARNVAAAFDTIHAHGHVIGDVNQGNVFVGGNALVRLIDCDSFQIAAGSTQFPCEVGVPHFSAPELLRAQSFRDVHRNAHHDNFGLAVLIFHLLFMGRHPFAGVYSGAEEMPIERAIKEFRYAFGADAATYLMARPPASVGPEIVSAELAGLFEHAFRKDVSHRPSAHRWVQALEGLSGEIRTCSAEGLHRFYGRLSACPWCELEVRDQLYFFVRTIPLESAPAGELDLSALWQQIEAARASMRPPSYPVVPSGVTPEPVPRNVKISAALKAVGSIGVLGIIILLIVLRPTLGLVWIMMGYWMWQSIAARPSKLEVERNHRQVALTIAEKKWTSVQRKWYAFADDGAVQKHLEKLHTARTVYENLRADHDAARRKLLDTGRERQLLRFLSRFHVEDVTIPNFGPPQIMALVGFGVETAAEVQRARLEKIGGLSPVLIDQLLAWRRGLEGMFKFDAARHGVAADQTALDQWYAQRYRPLAATLTEGLEELRRMAALYDHRRRVFLAGASVAGAALAQARANVDVC